MLKPLIAPLTALAVTCGTLPSFGQLIVSHRGASHDAPENTLAAFRLAWEQDADAIEGDFYLTKDEHIVCIHDKTTKRTAPEQPEYDVANTTLAELRTLDVGRWKGAEFAGERIPTLAEVLATVPQGNRIFIEIKCGPEIVPVLKNELGQSPLGQEQIVIICFDEDVVTASRQAMPHYKVNWLTSYQENDDKGGWSPTVDQVLTRLQQTGATGLGTQGNTQVVTDAFARSILDSGFEFHVWTVNDIDAAKSFAAMGAASITTDVPAVIRSALRAEPEPQHGGTVPFTIERDVMTKGYDGKQCWVHARPGVIPSEDPALPPTVVVTTQRLDISGSDVFHAIHSSYSGDLGRTWSPLVPQDGFERWKIDGRTDETICDFTPKWHAKTGRLLGIGQSVRYRDNRVMKVRPRFTGYSVYDPQQHRWSKPKRLEMPNEERFQNCGAGSVQRFDLSDGSILLPVYYKPPDATQYSVTVCRCSFDGDNLTYLEHGTELTNPVERGFVEPSMTKFGDQFFLTIRNDQHGFVAKSNDGLTFDQPKQWTFDDGSDLGNYNTQQHWISHPQGLFLAYTRKGANNDHVFRHRAPLFIAQVDPERLCVLRNTERILVPERGARLGNFGVTQVTPDETWIVVTEWMQTWKQPSHILPVDNPYGADNSVYIAKLRWN